MVAAAVEDGDGETTRERSEFRGKRREGEVPRGGCGGGVRVHGGGLGDDGLGGFDGWFRVRGFAGSAFANAFESDAADRRGDAGEVNAWNDGYDGEEEEHGLSAHCRDILRVIKHA